MIRKMSAVTLGIAAGLVATAPLASASQSHHEHEHDSAPSCSAVAGGAVANSTIGDVGDSAPVALSQAPVGGSNIGTCSSITVVDLGDSFELPELPGSEP